MSWAAIIYRIVLVFCAGALAFNVMICANVWWRGILDPITDVLVVFCIFECVAVVVNLWRVEQDWHRVDQDSREAEIRKTLLERQAELLRQQAKVLEAEGNWPRQIGDLRHGGREFTERLTPTAQSVLADEG
jgi:hypothetical protein